jgi:protein-tyrosine phosphatase
VTGNPSVPRTPSFSILVVCTANICRSPMGEYLLRMSLRSPGESVGHPRCRVSSAGVRAWVDAEMDLRAAAELRALGGDPTGFRARAFTVAVGLDADLILAATTEHRRIVLEEVPQALHKTFTLLEFAHLVSIAEAGPADDPREVVRRAAAQRGSATLDEYDVPDPYGQPVAFHRQTAEVIQAAAREIATGFSAS